ncbi:cationic amino acid transporter 2-like [Sinocyclocheilus grahami]|uniref:cationic amino acid transporter 2-like n=1 Tax=Sinocyclocheilus grahami TaxID=75366 RepID=UPI0007AC556E|nr:PREDICTED: cationic amino acid transporter 2-like [Sinocyclocheilus grahami]
MLEHCLTFGRSLVRRKNVDQDCLEESKLCRCLSTVDLIALGVGSTLGAGVYVLAGEVAKSSSGPSIVVSFLIAALASVMAGLCYAEFGARVPKTGSAYLYSYVTVGELWAFITGWNLILSYVIGTSSVARAWSGTFDELIGGHIEKFCKMYFKMSLPGLAEYPDFFAVCLILLLSECRRHASFPKADELRVVTSSGMHLLGSIFPMPRVIYAMAQDGVLFKALAQINPKTKTPLIATMSSGVVAVSVYHMLISKIFIQLLKKIPIITYDWKNTIGCTWSISAPSHLLVLVNMFFSFQSYRYLNYDSFFVFSLLGSMFPLPRILFAMSRDGVLFRFLSKVSKRQSPVAATMAAGTTAAIMAFLFDLKVLVDMMSIGTLLAYSLVAACVLILRYQPDAAFERSRINEGKEEVGESELTESESHLNMLKDGSVTLRSLLNPPLLPTEQTSTAVNVSVMIMVFFVCVVSTLNTYYGQAIIAMEPWALGVLGASLFIFIMCMLLVCRQPQTRKKVSFMVSSSILDMESGIVMNVRGIYRTVVLRQRKRH